MAIEIIQIRTRNHFLEIKYDLATGEPEIKTVMEEDNDGLIVSIGTSNLAGETPHTIRWDEGGQPFIHE